MTLYYITTILTMLMCLAISVIALIRLRLCNGEYRPRRKYTFVLSVALFGVAQPILGHIWPGATAMFLSMMFLVLLIKGVPPFREYKDTNDFFDTNLYDVDLHGEEE